MSQTNGDVKNRTIGFLLLPAMFVGALIPYLKDEPGRAGARAPACRAHGYQDRFIRSAIEYPSSRLLLSLDEPVDLLVCGLSGLFGGGFPENHGADRVTNDLPCFRLQDDLGGKNRASVGCKA